MARNKNRRITHGPKALDDAGKQCLVVALRQIGATDGSGKQHITHKSPVRLGTIKDHMAGRMTGTMPHLQSALAQRHGVVIGQPARRREAHRLSEAEHFALGRQAVDPELIGLMRADDGQMKLRRQFTGASGMIDVSVGQPDLAQRQLPLLHSGQQQVEIATRVNEGRLQGLVTPDKRAILLKIGDRNGLVA